MQSARKVPADLASNLDVSRETIEKLEHYASLVVKWQRSVNLVANSTIPDLWTRHIWDSAQLAPLVMAQKTANAPLRILDIGSGAGFPGLVLSILTDAEVHLVESDQKKCIFMNNVIRECGLTARIHNVRLETLDDQKADIVTARALASMDKLMALLDGQLRPGLRCLFLKGRQVQDELAVLNDWANLHWQLHPSLTQQDAFVVDLTVIS